MIFSKIVVLKSIKQNVAPCKIVGVCHIEKKENYAFNIELYSKSNLPLHLTIIDSNKNITTTILEDKLKQTYYYDNYLCEEGMLICIYSTTPQINIIALGYYNYTNFEYEELINTLKTQTFQPKTEYNDEQIASENYYEYYPPIQVKMPNSENQPKKEETKFDFSPPIDEELHYSSTKTYTVNLDKLNEILSSSSKYQFLTSIMPCSKFVKVAHSNSKEYIVGAIYYDNSFCKVKYLCFAIEGEKDNLPKSFNGKSKFIPFKQSSPYSFGVHIIFQDAISGKIV